jgi:uncharacterized protein YutE (UPF0331/DUF86 family)
LVDPEVVRRRLRDMEERIEELGRVAEAGRNQFLGDRVVRTAAERDLQLAIHAASLVWEGVEHRDDLMTFATAIERYLE